MNKVLLPIFILLLAGVGAWLTIVYKQEPEKKVSKRILPVVEVITVKSQPHTLVIRASGVIEAPTMTVLTAEVFGRVIEVSPAFENGGFFKKGDVLLKIDSSDYLTAQASAVAALAEAKYKLELELAEAKQASEEWKLLGEGNPTSLALRLPQVERARADVRSAQAVLEQAERDLERTQVKAPYDGRVMEAAVNVGQYIGSRGMRMGMIYATDYAEVRLPITDRQASMIDLPLRYEGVVDVSRHPPIKLTVQYGDEVYAWAGVIERVEGMIDRETRMLHVIGRISEPYRERSQGQPPLKIGMFAKTEIKGKHIAHAYVLPRIVMLEDDLLLVLDEDNRLSRRVVNVVQTEGENVIIKSGLVDGERVIMTPLEYIVDGMKVEPFVEGLTKP